jgi:hypothetical protein
MRMCMKVWAWQQQQSRTQSRANNVAGAHASVTSLASSPSSFSSHALQHAAVHRRDPARAAAAHYVSLLVLTVHIVTISLGINLGRHIIFPTPSRRVAASTLCFVSLDVASSSAIAALFVERLALLAVLFIF